VLHFTVVAFLDEVALGAELQLDDLPPHVLLLDHAITEADLGQVTAEVELAYASHGPFEAIGGDDDELGQDARPATLLDDDGSLVVAHRTLVLGLRELGVRVADPTLTGVRYQPHAPVPQSYERVDRGERIELRSIAILEIEPEGSPASGTARVAEQSPLI
jgi:hypothetical protein